MSRTTIWAIAVAALIAAPLGAPSSALADERTFTDGSDELGVLDIASATHGHRTTDDGTEQIVHTATMHEEWTAEDLAADRLNHISWSFDTDYDGQTERAVRVSANSDGTLHASMIDRGEDRGEAEVWRPDDRSVAIAFDVSFLALDDDQRYDWELMSWWSKPGDQECWGETPQEEDGSSLASHSPVTSYCMDWLPAGTIYITHNLRATAAPPEGTCLDVEPEARVVDTTYRFGAQVTISLADASTGTCDGSSLVAATGDVNVDVEIAEESSGDGFSPESPDRGCVITIGDTSCTIGHVPPSNVSETEHAWVDLDGDNRTIELDQAEGLGESSSPGDMPEPDFTDVALARGYTSHSDPCSAFGGCTEISLRYNKRRDRFYGEVTRESYQRCFINRTVVVKKVRETTNVVVGSAATDRLSAWKLRHQDARGKFYAVAPPRAFTGPNGEARRCRRLKSVTIRVR